MLDKILALPNNKNWLYLILKIGMVLALSLLLLSVFPRTVNSFISVRDIAIPAIIGLVSVVIIFGILQISRIKKYAPFAVLIADWALIVTYLLYLPSFDTTFLLPVGIMLIITVSGLMYVGVLFGTIEVIGSIIAFCSVILARPEIDIEALISAPRPIIPTIFFGLIILIISLLWNTSLDEENSSERKKVRREIESSRKRLDDMRERTRAVAEMAARLNASLNFDKILDASLDLGRLSVYNNASARVISMALLVTNDDGEMTITSQRGLQHTDLHHTFSGQRGIIARAMEAGEPIIYDGGGDDPELGLIHSFALIKSTLVIPLRANYETYGVLVFGSSERNAINEDHIDSLAAIGVQATVALQNAVLYSNLSEEKERILRIEENGRKALVRDLHDIPTQTVSAIAMHLSTIPTIMKRYPERVETEIANIRGMALRATEELRHVMFTIRPLSLESSGLKTALDQLADKMQKTYKQPMQVKIDERIDTLLDKDAKGSLFYLIEEATNNARKYAEASMVQVQGGIQGNEVVIRIRDNGKGFDTVEVGDDYENRGSFGMVNMRERAELINASFDLQSARGKGTHVTVRVPISDDSANVPILKPRRPIRKKYTGPLSPSV